MIAVVFSDLHIHRWKEFSKPNEDGINDRLIDCVSVIRDVARIADQENADEVWFAGDLYHRGSLHYTDEYILAHAAIAKLASGERPFRLIPGNHDHTAKDGTMHTLDALRHIRGVRVHDVPEVVVTSDRKRVLFLPYTRNVGSIPLEVEKAEPDFVLLHVGLDGAYVGSFEHRMKEPLQITDLPPAFYLSGHYHKPQGQVLREGGENEVSFTYVGAPLQHIRSDRGEQRGVLVLDTKRKTVKSIPLNYPRFVLLTDQDIAEKDEDEWDVDGNFVDVVLREEPSGGIARFRELMQELPARGVNVVFLPKEKKKAAKRLQVDASMSLSEMAKRYLDKYAPPGLDRSMLDQLAREFTS